MEDQFAIRMLETTLGKDDGPATVVMKYEVGETYHVGRNLRRAFVEEMKVAEDAEGAPAAEPKAVKNTKVPR